MYFPFRYLLLSSGKWHVTCHVLTSLFDKRKFEVKTKKAKKNANEKTLKHSVISSDLCTTLQLFSASCILSAEHCRADIVIKSASACLSSLHSPVICQPCSGGRLRKYMQTRWIWPPSHTSPPISVSFTHQWGSPTPLWASPPPKNKKNTHTPQQLHLTGSPPFRDDPKPIKLIEAF